MENILAIFIIFSFGCIIGSFLNVVILRLPQEKTLSGRSACPSCGHVLSPFELVPLFSFVFLLGKCRNCRKRISWRYFLIELFTGLMFLSAWLIFGHNNVLEALFLIKSLLLISIFIVVFIIDFEHYLILDKVVFPSIIIITVLNFAISAIQGNPLSINAIFIRGILGAILAALPFFAIWYFSKGLWMGFGDVKLALLLGAAFGGALAAANIMLAIFLGGLVSILLMAFRHKTLNSKVPFGTFLSIAGIATIFFGERILNWYLRLLGF